MAAKKKIIPGIDDQPITTYSLNKQTLSTYTQVTEATLNSMIQQLDYGNFDESVKVKNKLLQDDRLAAVLNAREFNLLDSAISVVTDITQSRSDAELIQTALNKAEQEIKLWYGNSLLLGAGLLQIIYGESIQGSKRPIVLQNYEPFGLRYDLHEDIYFLITSYKTQDDSEKEKRIQQLKSSHGYVSLAQYQQNFDVEIITGNPKWILCELGSKGFRNGLIRSLCWTYLNKQLAIVAKNKWSSKTAGVVKKLMVPAASDPAANKAFARSVKNMLVDDCVTLPQTEDGPNYDVQYLEANAAVGTSYQAYENTIDTANADYAISILSNNLTTEVTSGSLAASITHADKENKLAKSDKEFVQAILNDQLLRSYRLINSPDLQCNIIVNKDTSDEIRQQLDLLQFISNVNDNLSSNGMAIDLEKLVGAMGIDWIKVIVTPEIDESASALTLTPSDVAAIVTVAEARASQGLPPFGDERDNLTLFEFANQSKGIAAPESPQQLPAAPTSPELPASENI